MFQKLFHDLLSSIAYDLPSELEVAHADGQVQQLGRKMIKKLRRLF
jgi:hypothetical protein